MTLYGWPKDRFVHDAVWGGLWVNWILCRPQSDWEVKQEVSLLPVLGSSTGAPLHQPCLHVTVHVLLYYLSIFLFYFLFYESNRYKQKPPVLQHRREMQKGPEASCLTPSAAVGCDTANIILHHVAGLLDGAFSSFSKYSVFLQSRLPCVCFVRRKPLGYLHTLNKAKNLKSKFVWPFQSILFFQKKKNY